MISRCSRGVVITVGILSMLTTLSRIPTAPYYIVPSILRSMSHSPNFEAFAELAANHDGAGLPTHVE